MTDWTGEGESTKVVIVGAGPCGLAAGIAMRRADLPAILFERSCVVSGIVGYPTYMTFFSTAERLAIGGVPFVVATEKPTRRDALAYYRSVTKHFQLDVRQYERVERIDQIEEGFVVHTVKRSGAARHTRADAIVIATGYFGSPNRLGVPGEDLPHVSHRYREGHEAFARRAVVVGGGNSAVDCALDLYRSGAMVTMVHFADGLDKNIKPWVLPDISARISEGNIAARWESRVTAIEPEHVVLDTPRGRECVAAEHVYLMIGYMPETGLLTQLGAPIDSVTGIPVHDPATMETAIPNVFIAGVLASGYDANKTFIENGRFHGELIARRLLQKT